MKKPLGAKRAEKVGFEPTVRYKRTLLFKSSAISQTLPLLHNVSLLVNSLLSPFCSRTSTRISFIAVVPERWRERVTVRTQHSQIRPIIILMVRINVVYF